MDLSVRRAVLEYRIREVASEIKGLNRRLSSEKKELKLLREAAEMLGPSPSAVRDLNEVLDEIRLTDARLEAVGKISPEAEKMYKSYSKMFDDLSVKTKILEENRAAMIEELNRRIVAWKKALSRFTAGVDSIYREILSELGATGYVKLTNLDDVENAGLDLFVGFKGSSPIVVDGYSQSGGERITSIMAFLLATQNFIKSPFRAVDEYDVHMDPRNREVIANLLLSSIEGSDTQYVAITPSQLTFTGKAIHLITVQNVDGASIVRERM